MTALLDASLTAERSRRRRELPRMPVKGVRVSVYRMALLAALGVLGLLLLHREAGRLNRDIVTVARPARELLGEVQFAFSRRIYALHEYLLTSDEGHLALYAREDARLGALTDQLSELLSRLGMPSEEEGLDRLLASWGPVAEGWLGGDPEVAADISRIAERDSLHALTLAAMSDLRDDINAQIAERLARIRTSETIQLSIAIFLALLAMGSAWERARLAELERRSREDAEAWAQAEAALRVAAAAVASARTVPETLQRIAESALSSSTGDGALVERIHLGVEEVEIVASSGRCDSHLHERFAYADSVSRTVVEHENPMAWNESPASGGTPVLERYLRGGCEGGKVLAVPLIDEDRPIGSLVVVRAAGRGDFDDDESDRLRVFADLAALEFQRISLLTESEHRRRELERVTESRARLMRGFTHDVKNALGAADGYAQLMLDGMMGETTEPQRISLAHLRRAIGGALRLTEDLLSLAHAEAGHIDVDWVSTDARQIAEDVAEAYRPQAAGKGITITLDATRGLPLIFSDPARISQVLGNLLSNAVKYAHSGGRVRMILRTRVDGDPTRPGAWLCISVVDDGPGIPEEQQSSVFEEFVRLAPDEDAGSGLGLAISRHVARALRGDLTVTSVVGSGSEFTLWLPLGRERDSFALGPAVEP